MSDARYPERWLSDRRIQRLTDRAYRGFVSALAWSVSNKTDGYLEPEDLPLIPGFANGVDDELAASGLWLQNGRGWLIEPFEVTQATKMQIEAADKARASNRERQARWRLAHADDRNVTRNVTKPVTETVTERVKTQDRTGQALQPVLGNGDIPPTDVTSSSLQKPVVVTKSGTSPGERPKKRAERLPQGWQPPEDVIRTMHAQFPWVDLRAEHEVFCDYWHAKAGVNATKLDWVATWRNWMRRKGAETPQHNGHQISRADQKAMEWLALGRQQPQKGLPQ